MWRIIKQKCNAISARFVTAMHTIPMIVTSLVQTVANIGFCPGTYLWVTSQIAIAYVIEAFLFFTLLSQAMAFGGSRKQLGEGNFTDKCYQMALCKRSRLIIIFPSTCERYTHAGWALNRSPIAPQHGVMLPSRALITDFMQVKADSRPLQPHTFDLKAGLC